MKHAMTDARTRLYGHKLSTFVRVAALALLATFAALLALPAQSAEPSVTFGASVTNAAGVLNTTLTWSTTPAATACTASGHSSWIGPKAASGNQALAPITLSGSYSLTLDCSWPTDGGATLEWVAPTKNTDGSALAKCAAGVTSGGCLGSFLVYRRFNSADLANGAEMTQVNDPNATSKVFTGLIPGTHYFGVEAMNADGTPSDLSAVVSKVIAGAATKSASVTLTVGPKPGVVTGVTAK